MFLSFELGDGDDEWDDEYGDECGDVLFVRGGVDKDEEVFESLTLLVR